MEEEGEESANEPSHGASVEGEACAGDFDAAGEV